MLSPFIVDLSGKVAIVTGGSGTLCFGIAAALAENGARVALIGRNPEKMDRRVKELNSLVGKGDDWCKGYCADVCNKESLEKAYEAIKNELGPCDILINGAGGNKPGAITPNEELLKDKTELDSSFWNLAETDVRDVLDLNYMGTLLPTQVFTKDMLDKRCGSIINIASVAAILPLTKVITYSNAKSAIISLTQWLATHFGKSGIRCNAIAPGFYDAEQNHNLLFNEDGTMTPRAEKIVKGTPMGRFGVPEDLVGAALFLASDKASGFINGVVLPVDGGFSVYSGV